MIFNPVPVALFTIKEPAHGARVGAHRADLVEADELVVEAKVLHAARVAADADLVGAFAEVLAAHAALGEVRWRVAGVAVIEGVVVGRGGMRVAAVDVRECGVLVEGAVSRSAG